MPSFSMAVTGLDLLIRKIEGVSARIQKNVASETYQFGEEIMADSKQIVPVDTGTLMSTGHVQPPEIKDSEISVAFGYGGPAAKYAIYVHENLTAVNWTRPGSGPKYLETPFVAKQDQFPIRIKEAVQRSVKG